MRVALFAVFHHLVDEKIKYNENMLPQQMLRFENTLNSTQEKKRSRVNFCVAKYFPSCFRSIFQDFRKSKKKSFKSAMVLNVLLYLTFPFFRHLKRKFYNVSKNTVKHFVHKHLLYRYLYVFFLFQYCQRSFTPEMHLGPYQTSYDEAFCQNR